MIFVMSNFRKERDMYIIVGLGNPKKEYDNTRHNIGFDVIDALADMGRIGMTEKKHKAIIGKGIIGGRKVILAKPQTYMNLSGESVRELMDYYKIDETMEEIKMQNAAIAYKLSNSSLAAVEEPQSYYTPVVNKEIPVAAEVPVDTSNIPLNPAEPLEMPKVKKVVKVSDDGFDDFK